MLLLLSDFLYFGLISKEPYFSHKVYIFIINHVEELLINRSPTVTQFLSETKTRLGCFYVTAIFLYLLFRSFWNPNGVFLGLKYGSKTDLESSHIAEQTLFHNVPFNSKF